MRRFNESSNFLLVLRVLLKTRYKKISTFGAIMRIRFNFYFKLSKN